MQVAIVHPCCPRKGQCLSTHAAPCFAFGQVQRVLEICGETDSAGTAYMGWLLSRQGVTIGSVNVDGPRYVRPQLVRHVVEAFWAIHFDSSHPMQRRMQVVPLEGSRKKSTGAATLLTIAVDHSKQKEHCNKESQVGASCCRHICNMLPSPCRWC